MRMISDGAVLHTEIVDTLAGLCYQGVKATLESGAKFDYAHFWEDVCFKNDPLISFHVFKDYIGSYYKKITDLLHSYGKTIVSVDCDGLIDSLIPTGLSNGGNAMLPIEVGNWKSSIRS